MKNLKSNVNDIATFSKLGFLINIKIFSIFILLSMWTSEFINLKFCNYEIHLELQLLLTSLVLPRFYFSTYLDYVQFYSKFKKKK